MSAKNFKIDPSHDRAIFTVASKNRLSGARVLARSLQRAHPDIRVFVILVDRVEGKFDPGKEPFTTIPVEELGFIPNREFLFFKYDAMELSTAFKPYGFDYLLTRYNFSKILYFDSDILVFGPLDEVWRLLDSYALVLTPHITEPYEDNYSPSEIDINIAGIFNAGFIGLADTTESRKFISWWQKKLYDYCIVDSSKGLLLDQKWVNFAPVLFDGVFILRSPIYNIAYWNLHSRAPHLSFSNGCLYYDGVPAGFFHFSGLEIDHLETVSRHQNRFTLSKLPHLRPLFEHYHHLMMTDGYTASHKWEYAFDFFDNAVRIPQVARRIYWSMPEQLFFGNPFATKTFGNFFQWLNREYEASPEASPAPVSNLLVHIYRLSPDLQKSFPNPAGADYQRFKEWVRAEGPSYLKLHPVFTKMDFSENQFIKPSRQGKSHDASRVQPKFGLNVCGYITGEVGLGQTVRANIHALKAAGVPCALNDVSCLHHHRRATEFTEFSQHGPYPINLIHVNADAIINLRKVAGRKYFDQHYNIAVWWWELENFPEYWSPCLNFIQEIWTQSLFCQKIFQRFSSVPVFSFPHVVDFDESKVNKAPEYFGIPENTFTFVFSFSFSSVLERKNPLGLLEAYRRAFGGDSRTLLIIKSIDSHHYKDQATLLRSAARGLNVRFIDENLTHEKVLGLIASADCYVSLHRSEGFGQGMAEAMFMGKPVIATAYSGNLDFMTSENSFLVNYQLAELEQNYGPYEKGNRWAEPDLDHAAELMRQVYEDRDLARRKAERAAADIRANHSRIVVGAKMRERLRQITE